jgi:RimJ/RimL family protein N-acetyltransferase
MGHPYWPLFDLEIRTPRITVRYIDDEIGVEVAALAARGVHDPDVMPFLVPWTDATSPFLERGSFQHWWRCRTETTPERWVINFAVFVDDVAVGAGSLGANEFPILRSVETGSWLGLQHHGQGIGKEFRSALLHLAFDGFGAEEATTSAFSDNRSSMGVTRSLGYSAAGSRRVVRRGVPAELHSFRMPRPHWHTIRRDDIVLHGAAAAADLLGIPPLRTDIP